MLALLEDLGLTPLQAKWATTGIVVILLAVVRLVVLRVVQKRVDDPTVWYRTRKLVSYVIGVIGVLIIAALWVQGSGFGTTLGLATAGIAIALSDVLKNLAGWLFIIIRRPFRVGDRVEIDGHIGDVVDLRAFRFSMLEIGNWVDADQSTGRLMHVPNGLVFTKPVANYTEGFGFIWHEIPMLVTFESDWEMAKQIMQQALDDHAVHHDAARASEELRRTAASYQIMYTHLTPAVYLSVRDSGVLLTGRFLAEVRKRRGVENAIWTTILPAIAAEPTVELAYPTVRTFLPDALRVER